MSNKITAFLSSTRQMPKNKYIPPVINYPSRNLESGSKAESRIFSFWQNPVPGKRSGRSTLLTPLKGPGLVRWHRPHIRSLPGFENYKTEQERYRAAKNSFNRSRGKLAPKKGSGKKALKRAAEAKKAAAKAAKSKSK